jgi:hypothetical protein
VTVADLVQVLVDTSVTITQTFYYDGSPQDSESLPTLQVTYPSGTALSPTPEVSNSWTGPPARTTGQYRFVLNAQPEVTYLDYELSGTIGGKVQRLKGRVEWLGAQLFTLSELRGLKVAGGTPFASSTTWPNDRLQEARTATLDEFTQILGFSPVPRFHRRVLNGDGSTSLILPDLFATTVLSVTVNGVAQTASGYQISDAAVLEAISNYGYGAGFTVGRRNVVVEYVAGWDRPKGDGSNVAMLRAAMRLDPGVSSTATTVSTADGMSYTFDPAGQVTRGGRVREFGVPAIDSWLARHSQAGLAVA